MDVRSLRNKIYAVCIAVKINGFAKDEKTPAISADTRRSCRAAG